MLIKYQVGECSISMGRTNINIIGSFHRVEDAIDLHKECKETEYTWYEIFVNYNESL